MKYNNFIDYLFSNKISPWLSIQRKLKWYKEIYRYKNNANLTYNSKRHPNNQSRYELSNSLHDPFSMIEPRSFHREQDRDGNESINQLGD